MTLTDMKIEHHPENGPYPFVVRYRMVNAGHTSGLTWWAHPTAKSAKKMLDELKEEFGA